MPSGYPACQLGAILMGSVEQPPPPAPPYVFDDEMADYLQSMLGAGCYPLKVPEEVTDYPALTYTLVDGDSLLRLSGAAGQAWREYQFDCYSPVYMDAATLDEQLRKLLQALKGPMGRVTVQECNRHRPSGYYVPPPDASDDGIYRFMSEYTIWYLED